MREDGYYFAIYDGKPEVIEVWYNTNGVHYYRTGCNSAYSAQDFDRIGDKIELPKDQTISTMADTPKCEKCGGRTALVKGIFQFYPNPEPYENGVTEEAKTTINQEIIHGFVCDDCNNIQGLWHE